MGKAIFWLSFILFVVSLYEIFSTGFNPTTSFIVWCGLGAVSVLGMILNW